MSSQPAGKLEGAGRFVSAEGVLTEVHYAIELLREHDGLRGHGAIWGDLSALVAGDHVEGVLQLGESRAVRISIDAIQPDLSAAQVSTIGTVAEPLD